MTDKPSYDELLLRFESLEQAELERQEAQAMLAQAEKRSSVWLEHSPVCTKIINCDFKLQYMSKAGIEALGIEDITSFYGQSFPLPFYNDTFKEGIAAAMEDAKSSGNISTHEDALVGLNGNTHWFHSTVVPVCNEHNQLDYFIIVSSDVSERKTHELELENKSRSLVDSEAMLRQSAEMANIGHFKWDYSTQRMSFCSEELAHLYDMSVEQAMDFFSDLDKVRAVIHPDDRKLYDQAHDSAIRQKNDMDLKYRIITPSGNKRHVHMKGRIVFDEKGNPVTSFGLEQDITEQKARERDLDLALKKADQANRARSGFLATMSHEIRTPLNGIMGMSHLLNNSGLNDGQAGHVDAIIESGEILLELLNDVLDLSKIGEGQLVLDESNLDLESIFQKCHQLWSPRIEEKNIEFIIENNNIGHLNLQGDPTRFYQIMQNLIGNALKFTEKGKISVLADVEHETETEVLLRVKVRDSGIGIGEDAQDALFERFSQVDSSITRKYGGSGLGLSICRELANLMGGEVGVQSELGKGSTFWFTAKLKKLNLAEVKSNGSQVSQDTSSTNVQFDPRTKVLVAEDNIVNQKVITAFLKLTGLHPDIAENGLVAVEMAKAKNYDLVLMDIQMPELDGLAATARIQALSEHYQSVPIIALTANVSEENRDHYLGSGMTDYVGKPIDPSFLLEVLSNYIDRITEDVRLELSDLLRGRPERKSVKPSS